MIKILLLVSMINTGDVNHANSVAIELAKKIEGDSQTIKIDANKDLVEIEKEYTALSKSVEERYIVLVVGEKALQVFDHLSDRTKINAYTYCGIHQFNALLSKRLPIDHIGIPKTELDTDDKKAAILAFPHHTLTFAVPNVNPSIESLKSAYENWNLNNKPRVGNFIVVMLPGDAPDENNKMRFFTKESAAKIAQEITYLWKYVGEDYVVLIENGPRTGKFDPETGKVVGTHEFKKGDNPEDAIDKVTKHFIESLEIPKNKFQLFNFAFEDNAGVKNKISCHEQLLYLVQASKHNYFVVPGESISTIAQISLMLRGDHVIGVKPDSMNRAHTAIFNSAVEEGLISYFDNDGTLVQPQHANVRTEDDSVLVAGEVYEGFIEKFHNE